MQRPEYILSPDKARAFNPFLCAITNKLKALIVEVQKQVSGYEAYYQTRQRAQTSRSDHL
jgi:hypothetical protein